MAIAVLILWPGKEPDAASQYRAYCSGCHLPPDPANMPKAVWADHVLPEMAARLGYKYNDYDPLANNSMEENLYIGMSKTYPEKPAIDSAAWRQIHDYIIARAPAAIPPDTLRSKRNSTSALFVPSLLPLGAGGPAAVTNIQFEPASNQFLVGDAYGGFHRWPEPLDSALRFPSPVMSYLMKADGLYVTEVGYLNPSEIPRGSLYRIRPGAVDTLARKLHRPVYTEIVDLDGDGKEEILICEFGNLTGELALLVRSGAQFEKRTLLAAPGAIKVEIADMNQDGLKDIVLLAAQAREGIYILYQRSGLKFSLEQVVSLGPEYGSSWFELIDYNGDGHLDVVLANGDNADYSKFLKPYHGLRLFINDGHNAFEQKWFYPIYGATRVLAEDYDLDGDLDFAVLAFFPDFGHSLEEGFVFLENVNAGLYRFEPHTFPESRAGRWLVMGKGDFDGDGDVDILLGSFLLLSLERQYQPILDGWRKEKNSLLLLENKAGG